MDESGAACHGVDTDVFFGFEHERGAARHASEHKAKQICQRCPIVEQCLQRAVSMREAYGIWGGLTPHERNALQRRRSA